MNDTSWIDSVWQAVTAFGPAFFTLLVFAALYIAVKAILDRQQKGLGDRTIIRQIVLFLLVVVGLIAIILALPLGDSLRGQITSLMGIVISAVFALSSATFIGNMLAGILLRSINNFKPGDFITVENQFGRVSERGLFHTEIQTIDRNLTTLPNLYLATHPVKVVRQSGTFITASVSLGYDVSRAKIEKALLSAAEKADLKDPFVYVTELGDFSVVYKVHGLLTEIKGVLTAQSVLNCQVIDALHEARIEIVSPTFMNQRAVGDTVFIPKRKVSQAPGVDVQSNRPEDLAFDKADEAETIEKKRERLKGVEDKIAELEKAIKVSDSEEGTKLLKSQLERYQAVRDRIMQNLETRVENLKEKD